MEFKIDDNIPFSKRNCKTDFTEVYPVDQLKIGQSFLIGIDELLTVNSGMSIYYRITQAVKRYNEKHEKDDFMLCYQTRRAKKHGEEGIRIWKLAKSNEKF